VPGAFILETHKKIVSYCSSGAEQWLRPIALRPVQFTLIIIVCGEGNLSFILAQDGASHHSPSGCLQQIASFSFILQHKMKFKQACCLWQNIDRKGLNFQDV